MFERVKRFLVLSIVDPAAPYMSTSYQDHVLEREKQMARKNAAVERLLKEGTWEYIGVFGDEAWCRPSQNPPGRPHGPLIQRGK